jgi:hypothetical protein
MAVDLGKGGALGFRFFDDRLHHHVSASQRPGRIALDMQSLQRPVQFALAKQTCLDEGHAGGT